MAAEPLATRFDRRQMFYRAAALPSGSHVDLVLCIAVTIVSGCYLAAFAWRGWLPWDDGLLAAAAQRVVEGQLPHRDFDDLYTGGLALLHAGAFKLLGPSLSALRDTLFCAAIASVPLWYWICRGFAPPLGAAILTLTCFAWSVPNYPASMPSWYNLFCAMAALAAGLRYLQTRERRWVCAAGLAAGTSVLFKITGVYLIVAIATFLMYNSLGDRSADPRRGRPIGALVILGLVVLSAVPFALTASAPRATTVVELALPPAAITFAVGVCALREYRRGWAPSFNALRVYLAFAMGVAIPALVFLLPFAYSHALGPLVHGAFVLPQRRLDVATTQRFGPPLFTIGFALPLLRVLTAKRYAAIGPWHGAFIGLFFLAFDRLMVRVGSLDPMWCSVATIMMPMSLVIGWSLVGRETQLSETRHSGPLVLTGLVAAWCALIQFPFSIPVYFAYVAPLVLLCAVALSARSRGWAPGIDGPVLAGYLVLAITIRSSINPEYFRKPEPAGMLSPLSGIEVPRADSVEYSKVLTMLKSHSRSAYILATPDAPEIYFLSGLRNPTRTLYDMFDDTAGRNQSLLRRVESAGVTAIVINLEPQFSQRVRTDLRDSLANRFPHSFESGHFELRWR
jgi:hypothetical protein